MPLSSVFCRQRMPRGIEELCSRSSSSGTGLGRDSPCPTLPCPVQPCQAAERRLDPWLPTRAAVQTHLGDRVKMQLPGPHPGAWGFCLIRPGWGPGSLCAASTEVVVMRQLTLQLRGNQCHLNTFPATVQLQRLGSYTLGDLGQAAQPLCAPVSVSEDDHRTCTWMRLL